MSNDGILHYLSEVLLNNYYFHKYCTYTQTHPHSRHNWHQSLLLKVNNTSSQDEVRSVIWNFKCLKETEISPGWYPLLNLNILANRSAHHSIECQVKGCRSSVGLFCTNQQMYKCNKCNKDITHIYLSGLPQLVYAIHSEEKCNNCKSTFCNFTKWSYPPSGKNE